MRTSIFNMRNTSDAQHNRVREQLGVIIRGSRWLKAMLPLAVREIAVCIDKVKLIIERLLEAFGNFSVEALQMLKSILEGDLEIYALLRQIQAQIPTRPMYATEDCIKFTDALGRVEHLPYYWFQHWELIESMLKCKIKNLPSEQLVHHGQYYIINAQLKGQTIPQ